MKDLFLGLKHLFKWLYLIGYLQEPRKLFVRKKLEKLPKKLCLWRIKEGDLVLNLKNEKQQGIDNQPQIQKGTKVALFVQNIVFVLCVLARQLFWNVFISFIQLFLRTIILICQIILNKCKKQMYCECEEDNSFLSKNQDCFCASAVRGGYLIK